MKSITVIRVDPYKRTIAAMPLKAVRDCTPRLRQITRANNIGSREIAAPGGNPLMVIGGLDVDEAMKGWRLPGTDDTAGIAVLAGWQAADKTLISVPVTVSWVRDRIQWLEGEDVSERGDRAAELLPALNDDVRLALEHAVVLPDSGMWLSAEHRKVVGAAMLTLGLGTERSAGQQLTKLGEAVYDLLMRDGE